MKNLKLFEEFTEFDFDIPEHKEMGDLAQLIAKDLEFRKLWTNNIKEQGGVLTQNFAADFALDVIGQIMKNGYKISK